MLRECIQDPTSAVELFKNPYERCSADNQQVEVAFGGNDWSIEVWDTAGQEALAVLRKFAYYNASVFLLCYDMSKTDTLHNIEYYADEIQEFMTQQDVNRSAYDIILCGCKYDLWLTRKDEDTVDLEQVAQVSALRGRPSAFMCAFGLGGERDWCCL